MNYFVAKTRDGAGFVGSYDLEEISKQLRDGKMAGDYVATKSYGPSYSQLLKLGTPNWITVGDLVDSWTAHNALNDSAADENTGSGNPVVQTKYPALRVISVIFKVLAVLAALAGLIGALMGLVQMSGNTYGAPAPGGVIVLVSLLYGGLGCIYLLAISEGIRVFIDIEVNTRLTNELLRKLLDR